MQMHKLWNNLCNYGKSSAIYKKNPTIFRGLKCPKTIVWTMHMWISRDYLWISASRCGQVACQAKNSPKRYPYIWPGRYSSSKIWSGLRNDFLVDIAVDKFLRIFPQGEALPLAEKS